MEDALASFCSPFWGWPRRVLEAYSGIEELKCVEMSCLHSWKARFRAGDSRKAQSVLAKSALEEFERELPHPGQRMGGWLLKRMTWRLGREKALDSLGLQKAVGRAGNRVLAVHFDRGRLVRMAAGGGCLGPCCSAVPGGLHGLRAGGEPATAMPGAVDRRDLAAQRLDAEEQAVGTRVDLSHHGFATRDPGCSPFSRPLKPEVLQSSIMKEFPAREAKALLGFEVGRILLSLQESPSLELLAKCYFVAGAGHALRMATEPNPGLAGAPLWIRHLLGSKWRRPYVLQGTTAQLAVFGTIVRRLVPGPLQLPLFAGLQANHRSLETALRGGPLRLRLRAGKERPLQHFGTGFVAVNLMRLVSGSTARAFVLTLDRAAALAAGDAKSAASALLRSQRLLPHRLGARDLDQTLASFAAEAQEKAWAWRRELLLRNPSEPAAALRVAELLRWAQEPSAKRLLALAEVRRHGLPFADVLWRPALGHAAVWALLLLPLLTPIDAVRWAAWCTMSLTLFALALPLLHLLGAPQLPGPAILSLGRLDAVASGACDRWLAAVQPGGAQHLVEPPLGWCAQVGRAERPTGCAAGGPGRCGRRHRLPHQGLGGDGPKVLASPGPGALRQLAHQPA